MKKSSVTETFVENKSGYKIYLDSLKRFVARDKDESLVARSTSYNTLVRKMNKNEVLIEEYDKYIIPKGVIWQQHMALNMPGEVPRWGYKYFYGEPTGETKIGSYDRISLHITLDDGSKIWKPTFELLEGTKENVKQLNELVTGIDKMNQGLQATRQSLKRLTDIFQRQKEGWKKK